MPVRRGTSVGPNLSSAPGSPVEGQMYQDTTSHKFYVHNGTNWVPLTKTVRTTHTFSIQGEIKVPSGDTDFIPPFFVSLATGQTGNIVKARYKINSGTSATCKITKNGSDLSGYTGISVGTTAAETTGAQAIADNDLIGLVVTAVSAVPTNLSFTIVMEYTVS